MDSRTQDFIPIQNIENGMVISKNGSVGMIIQTSAVNFDLLSEAEQMAIIGSFAGLLNSLSFSIQIVIRSKKMDITSYLEKLVAAEQQQTNPLLKKLMQNYRSFVSSVIRENEVLDKQFYVVISVSSMELGLIFSNNNREVFLQKALTALTPRRDHLIRQLGRIGLKASQLDDEKLVKLFYDWYNEPVFDVIEKRAKEEEAEQQKDAADAAAALSTPPVAPAPANTPPPLQATTPAMNVSAPVTPVPDSTILGAVPAQSSSLPPAPLPMQNVIPQAKPISQNPYPNVYPAQQINLPPVGANNGVVNQTPRPVNTPFVVEELHDDYGTA